MNIIFRKIFKSIINIFNKNSNYVINIKKKTNVNKEIIIAGIKFYRQNIKELNKFNFQITNNNCFDLYNFYNEIIPIFSKQSQNAFIRNKLINLSQKKQNELNNKISTFLQFKTIILDSLFLINHLKNFSIFIERIFRLIESFNLTLSSKVNEAKLILKAEIKIRFLIMVEIF